MNKATALVKAHYTRGDLAERVNAGLEKLGVADNPTIADLAPLEEFHSRGRAATKELAEQLTIDENTRTLDVGSGIGGPARYLADRFGTHVTGIDLTPEYVEVATMLSERTGLSDRTAFVVGDATALPLPDESFDLIITEHATMNIEDKDRLYAEMFRVLKQGGTLALFDIMAGDGELVFPVPWADTQEESFLIPPNEVRQKIERAGFSIISWVDKTPAVKSWLHESMAKMAQNEPPPIGLHLIFGEKGPAIFKNYGKNLEGGRIQMFEGIAKKQ